LFEIDDVINKRLILVKMTLLAKKYLYYLSATSTPPMQELECTSLSWEEIQVFEGKNLT